MWTAKALFLTLFAIVTLVSCTVTEDGIVQETTFVQKLQPMTTNGGVGPKPETIGASAGPTDQHDDVPKAEGEAGACDAGMMLCSDGVCATECTLSGDNGAANPTSEGLKMNFSPEMHRNPLPPKVAGSASDYEHLETNFKRSEQADRVQEIEKAEQSAALGFGSHQLALEEHTQHMQAWAQKVEMKMNTAAKKAAEFKKETDEHNTASNNVHLAHTKVVNEDRRVKEAKATLTAELNALQKAKEFMTKQVRIEEHTRFIAEQGGNTYQKARADAIAEDNALQQEKHETEMKEEYEKVALSAVAKKAQEDEKAVEIEQQKAQSAHDTLQKHKAAAKELQDGKKEKKEDKPLEDCKVLPKVYAAAGGKCADCPKWKAKGECEAAEYKKFMAHYCAASCAAKDVTPL